MKAVLARSLAVVAAALLPLGMVSTALAHQAKDTPDGKYQVTFGASPEPVITDAAVRIEFRINLKADSSLVKGLQPGEAVVSQDGTAIKTYAVKESSASRKGPGTYDTDVLIVPVAGIYPVKFSFADGAGNRYALDFEMKVDDRGDLFLTGAGGTGSAEAKLQADMTIIRATHEKDMGALRTDQMGMRSSPSWLSPVALLGLVVGIVALGGTGFALSRKR